MKRIFKLIYAAIFASVSIGLVGLWVMNGKRDSSPSASEAIAPEMDRSQRDYRSEPVSQGVGNVDLWQPGGRYVDANVLSKRVLRSAWNEVEAVYLVEGDDARIPFILLEERYGIDEETNEFALRRQTVAKGDEIMLDADPREVDEAMLDRILEEEGWVVVRRSRLSHYLQIATSNPTVDFADEAIDRLSAAFPNANVSKDHLHFTSAIPSEYREATHWHLRRINAVDAWSRETGSEEVAIAILDTGCFVGHEDLAENIFVNPNEIPNNGIDDDGNGFVDDVSGWDFYDDDAIADDETGHGTHVSGIVGAVGNNGLGGVGIGWDLKILPLKVGGSSGLSSSAIAEALRYVTELKRSGANIVATNNSYGSGAPNTVAQEVVRRHEEEGILFIAAAGNDGVDIDEPGSSQFPAGFEEANVISVANSTQGDELSSGSNYGYENVDIAAPGQEIYSTDSNGGYLFLTGTSMSSPIVAGAVGLVASSDPTLSSGELKARLLNTAARNEAFEGKMVSEGRLDLLAALDPGLRGHSLAIPSHPAALVLLPRYDIPIEMKVEALEKADVTVQRVSGPASVSVVEDGPRVFSFHFDRDGFYRFRFTSIIGGIERSAERMFAIGSIEDVDNGLLHAWDMEESNGALVDSAGNGDGELVGAARVETPLGRGVDFSGNNSFARFNSRFSPRVTLSAFVRSDDLLSSPHPRIIDGPDYYLYFSTRGTQDIPDGNANALKFYSNRTGDFGVWHSPPDTVFENEWVHVLASYDSASLSSDPRLYINGQKQAVRLQRLPTGVQTDGGGDAYLGDRADGTRAWDGQMDEIRIYERTVTDSEAGRLASRYLEALWDDYGIAARGEVEVGRPIELVLENSEGLWPEAEFEWFVESEKGLVGIENPSGPSVTASFEGADNARFFLKAAGRSATRYYSYDLFLEPLDVRPGIYSGATANGGLVWVETNEAVDRGEISVLDETLGLRRFREPIRINAWGGFQSIREAVQSISGDLDGGLVGSVDGVALGFSGEWAQTQAGALGFEGRYSGGAIGLGGESIVARITDSGGVFYWSDGANADAGIGVVNSSGRFEFSTERGAVVSGVVDADTGTITGELSSAGESASFFLRSDEMSGDNRYVNLSTRSLSEFGEGILIGGFTVGGAASRTLLIRGIGPDLARRGVANPMGDPAIELLKGSAIISSNDDWGDYPDLDGLRGFEERSGAADLVDGSADAAMLVELDPGVYTVFVRSDEGHGEALFEVFDDPDEELRALVNISSRGPVRGIGDALIGGFSVIGDEPKQVLIRGVGPGLADKGIANPLADPEIQLYSGQSLLSSNDDWAEASAQLIEGGDWVGPAAALRDAFRESGAFDFVDESKDAALLVWLNPGVYTVVLRGVDDTQGIGLIEVYELD